MSPTFVDSDSDGVSEFENEENILLSNSPKNTTFNLNIRASYTKWDPVEAFREIVQNWRDAIIESFNLREDQFEVIRKERKEGRNIDIVYRVPDPRQELSEYLGYIQFFGRDEVGYVNVVNRQATLEPWHLDIGGTSKTGRQNQAGAHGEGLKIALLVLQRRPQNHGVKCTTGTYTWSFNFNNAGKLVARLRRMLPNQISKAAEQSRKHQEKSLAPFAPSVQEDVQFRIGDKVKGRNEFGGPSQRNRVSLEEFNNWCKAALFLQDPDKEGMIQTSSGDLVTDERLCGNIYLKGLLLRESYGSWSASITGKPLKFGYNFQAGITNRERQSVDTPLEECQAILRIWGQVLVKKPDYVSYLHDLLISSDIEYADVSASRDVMNFSIAVRLKDHLFSESTKWYYSPKERSKNGLLDKIIQGLGREGVELTDSYWSVLARHGLVRTAEAEQQTQFMNARIITAPPTYFAQETSRLVRACLQSCAQTRDISIQFVSAGQLSLHTFYVVNEQLFKIHERWLDKDQSIQELGLPENLLELDVLFHTVKRLFADMVDEVPIDQFGQDQHYLNIWHKKRELSLAEQRLLEYTWFKKSLFITPCLSEAGAIQLRWDSDFSLNGDTKLTVQFHDESTCGHLRQYLMAKDFDESVDVAATSYSVQGEQLSSGAPYDDRDESRQASRCFETTCKPSPGCLKFSNLTPGATYFAVMFQRADPRSIAIISEFCTAPLMPDSPNVESQTNQTVHEGQHSVQTELKSNSPSLIATTLEPSSFDNEQLPRRGILRGTDDRSMHHALQPEFPRVPPSEEGVSSIRSLDDGMPAEAEPATDMTGRSYTPGNLLDSLDILKPRDWFAARNEDATRVVIGIQKEESNDTQEGRKRRRLDE